MDMSVSDLLLIVFAFGAGGIIKGATGAGAPLLAVPVMIVLRDVQFAVAVFVLPNIVPNVVQFWQYRKSLAARAFAWPFALGGGIGAGLGTLALAAFHSDVLLLTVGVILVGYIIFRLVQPAWAMPRPVATRLAGPVGCIAGALQGATGLSAPVSLSFMSAVRFERNTFIATISLFFVFLGIAQLPAQLALGIMTQERLIYSALALVPLLAAMPVGAWIGRRVSREAFDKMILLLLFVLAVRLVWGSLS